MDVYDIWRWGRKRKRKRKESNYLSICAHSQGLIDLQSRFHWGCLSARLAFGFSAGEFFVKPSLFSWHSFKKKHSTSFFFPSMKALVCLDFLFNSSFNIEISFLFSWKKKKKNWKKKRERKEKRKERREKRKEPFSLFAFLFAFLLFFSFESLVDGSNKINNDVKNDQKRKKKKKKKMASLFFFLFFFLFFSSFPFVSSYFLSLFLKFKRKSKETPRCNFLRAFQICFYFQFLLGISREIQKKSGKKTYFGAERDLIGGFRYQKRKNPFFSLFYC